MDNTQDALRVALKLIDDIVQDLALRAISEEDESLNISNGLLVRYEKLKTEALSAAPASEHVEKMKADPNAIIALALSGSLPVQQAGEILRDAFAPASEQKSITDEQREAFENKFSIVFSLQKDESGDYIKSETHFAWLGYQTALSLQAAAEPTSQKGGKS